MAQINHIDAAKHAAKTMEILERRKERFIGYTLSLLSSGAAKDDVKERLVRKVSLDMEDEIFEYLKRTDKVRGNIRYDYTLGYPRRKYTEPRISEVPSNLLDVKVILPNFQELVDAMMVEAGKRKTVADIEATTKEVSGND